MFDALTDRLTAVFDKLKGRGVLKEEDVNTALREVRVALLEADVALPVVKDFVARVKERALGQEVLKSVTPGQMVVKIVNDELVEMLGGDSEGLRISGAAPAVIMMVGLQGSGKTTSTAKIAKRLKEKENKSVLMASLDTRRPAAQEQLEILGQQAEVPTLPIVSGQMPADIAKRALEAAKFAKHDVVMLDTAGRMHADESLMSELAAVASQTGPAETLLVADALTGQDAVNVAEQFAARVPVTGIVLTRLDGDARGGAALSMRAVTGCPIKMIGVGEKLDELEAFHPERIASRILGMGDVVSLVERASETIEAEQAEEMARKMKKGEFDLEDYREQIRQMKKMGGMSGILKMLPGMGKMNKQLADANLDETLLKRQEAIINSMTPKERRNVRLIAASRKKRIAKGSGTSVQDVNKLLKQHKQMAQMMKKMGKMGGMDALDGQMPPGFDQLMPR